MSIFKWATETLRILDNAELPVTVNMAHLMTLHMMYGKFMMAADTSII
jgi:hypothetical protein